MDMMSIYLPLVSFKQVIKEIDKTFLANELLKIKQERLRLKREQENKDKVGVQKNTPQKKQKRKDLRSKEDMRRRVKNRAKAKAAKQHGISDE